MATSGRRLELTLATQYVLLAHSIDRNANGGHHATEKNINYVKANDIGVGLLIIFFLAEIKQH